MDKLSARNHSRSSGNPQSATRFRWLAAIGACLAFAVLCPAPHASTNNPVFPELPKVSLDNFAPDIRRQIAEAYDGVRSKPRDPEANGRLGMLLQAYDQHESAALCYRRARQLAPGEFRWGYYLASSQAALGKHAEAIAVLRGLLERKPEYLPASLKLAESLLASGHVQESREIYDSVLKRDPASAAAHYGLGRAQDAGGEIASAAEHFRKACELFPGFGAAHYALALAYRRLGETDKAQEHLALYLKDKVSWPPVQDPLMDEIQQLKGGALYHVKQGVSLEAAGQMEAAIAEHERALEADPKHVQAHINLISLYGKLGKNEEAEKHYRSAVAINPNLAESHYNFGVLAVEQGKYKEAAEVFNRALEINPYYAEAESNLAYLLMTEGKLEDAERHYRAAIENKPNLRLAHFNLGRILVHQGKTQEAIGHFLQTLTPEDESTPGFMYALGAAYARAGERRDALRYIREARRRASALGQTELLASIDKDLRLLEGSVPP